MSFLAIHIMTHQQDTEALSDVLFDLGALSVSIEDQAAGTNAEVPLFGEPGAPAYALWENNMVTALFDETMDGDILMQAAINQLEVNLSYQLEAIADSDWVRKTQSQFEPICISDRLWITPSWHPIQDLGQRIYLELDPGLAFGTGSHPTTRLCLRWLDSHHLARKNLLDYGCGSGILTIAAIKLGATQATGVDIDPQAIIASKDNAKKNKVEVAFYDANTHLNAQYDIVIANILTNPLKVLAPALAQYCKPQGEIVLSGILSEQAEEIITLYSQWFTIATQENEEGWVLIHGYRHA